MNLTAKEIAYLLPSFTERTALSLFSNITDTPDGTEHGKLVQKGIIQGNGILRRPWTSFCISRIRSDARG